MGALSAPLLLFLGACRPDFVSVDDACPDGVDPGDPTASDDAVAAWSRAACYRSRLGLPLGALDARLDTAAQAHAGYMAVADELGHQETDASNVDYTGEWPWDRADAAGYTGWTGVSETVAYGSDADQAVDDWMGTLYHRIPFTMPEWDAVGFGLAEGYASMTFATPFPGQGSAVVLYPSDGQTGVPGGFSSDSESPDPVPGADEVGTPITLTVSATSTGDDPQNPYDLELLDASLSGPDGDVPFTTLTPTTDPDLIFAVGLVPEAPLAADSAWTATFHVRWRGGETTVSTSFGTS